MKPFGFSSTSQKQQLSGPQKQLVLCQRCHQSIPILVSRWWSQDCPRARASAGEQSHQCTLASGACQPLDPPVLWDRVAVKQSLPLPLSRCLRSHPQPVRAGSHSGPVLMGLRCWGNSWHRHPEKLALKSAEMGHGTWTHPSLSSFIIGVLETRACFHKERQGLLSEAHPSTKKSSVCFFGAAQG